MRKHLSCLFVALWFLNGCTGIEPRGAIERADPLPPTPDFQPRSFMDVAKAAEPAVALIICGTEGHATAGTGFHVRDGYILTAGHLMENGGKTFQAFFMDHKPRACKFVWEKADLLVLELVDKNDLPPTLPVRLTAPRWCEDVLVLGFPRRPFMEYVPEKIQDVFALVATHGMVSSPDIDVGNALTSMMLIDAGIAPGNSGGPVLGMDGKVIGIVLGMSQNDRYQGFSVPNSLILKYFGGNARH